MRTLRIIFEVLRTLVVAYNSFQGISVSIWRRTIKDTDTIPSIESTYIYAIVSVLASLVVLYKNLRKKDGGRSDR